MVQQGRGKRIAVMGDYLDDFKVRLLDMLKSRGRLGVGGFDMEPLEVLSYMLADPTFTKRTIGSTGLIGGAPQVTKVYRYGSSLPFAVEWQGERYLFGRKLLPFENTLNPIITLPSLQIRYPLDTVSN